MSRATFYTAERSVNSRAATETISLEGLMESMDGLKAHGRAPNFKTLQKRVILSEAKNPSWIAAIEEGFFASLRMTILFEEASRCTGDAMNKRSKRSDCFSLSFSLLLFA
jgi:hypothetical protein